MEAKGLALPTEGGGAVLGAQSGEGPRAPDAWGVAVGGTDLGWFPFWLWAKQGGGSGWKLQACTSRGPSPPAFQAVRACVCQCVCWGCGVWQGAEGSRSQRCN